MWGSVWHQPCLKKEQKCSEVNEIPENQSLRFLNCFDVPLRVIDDFNDNFKCPLALKLDKYRLLDNRNTIIATQKHTILLRVFMSVFRKLQICPLT